MATEERLIDANALMDSHFWESLTDDFDKVRAKIIVMSAPTVDAVEVVPGHNLRDHDYAFECSVCGWEDWDTLTADTSQYNYCPNCGAKMDGKT